MRNNNLIIDKISLWKSLNYLRILNNTTTTKYRLLDLVSFIGGSQPPKSEHIYEYKKGYVRFIQNRDYTNASHVTYIKESKSNKICDLFDIMMDKYGEAGKIRFGIKGAYNVALAKIAPKRYNSQEWIREFLSTNEIQQYLFNSSIASTRASVSENNLNNIFIELPDEHTLSKFEKDYKTILEIIISLKKENSILEKIKQVYLKKFFD